MRYLLFVIIGIGIDIVSVLRLREIISRSPRVLDRLVSLGANSNSSIESLAGFFAAYEALFKALPFESKTMLERYRLLHRVDGSPYFQVAHDENIRTDAPQKGIYLSITHEMEFAVAIVVIETFNHKLPH